MNKNQFINNSNLVDRIYEMLYSFSFFKNKHNVSKEKIKASIFYSFNSIENIESYAKYFDDKLRQKKLEKKAKFKLSALIKDLDYLKQQFLS